MRIVIFAVVALTIIGAELSSAPASDMDGRAAEMARKLQGPLSIISAVMTENKFLFQNGQNKTNYQFDIEPIFSIDFPDQGFTFIPRAVIPVLGAVPWNTTSGTNGVTTGGRSVGFIKSITVYSDKLAIKYVPPRMKKKSPDSPSQRGQDFSVIELASPRGFEPLSPA